MGLRDVVAALEHAEQLLEDGETGPAQDSLSWQRASDDADIQLGKACAIRRGWYNSGNLLGSGRTPIEIG